MSNHPIVSQPIRNATPADADAMAPLFIAAMESFACTFVGSDNPDDALPVFRYFAGLAGNQYSYANTLVYHDQQGVAGIVTGYDGAMLETLRAPFFTHLATHYGFNPSAFGNETSAGEYYIDTVSVTADRRGMGIGKALILAACAAAQQQGHTRAGLLVDATNPQAKKLYQYLGFTVQDTRVFAGGEYEHMLMML